jgi:hypothetical protein
MTQLNQYYRELNKLRTMIKSLRCLIRFFSFLPFTLPLFGWLAGIGSPGLHITQKCGPVDQQKQHPQRQPN